MQFYVRRCTKRRTAEREEEWQGEKRSNVSRWCRELSNRLIHPTVWFRIFFFVFGTFHRRAMTSLSIFHTLMTRKAAKGAKRQDERLKCIAFPSSTFRLVTTCSQKLRKKGVKQCKRKWDREQKVKETETGTDQPELKSRIEACKMLLASLHNFRAYRIK